MISLAFILLCGVVAVRVIFNEVRRERGLILRALTKDTDMTNTRIAQIKGEG